MIIRNDAIDLFFFAYLAGRPMTEVPVMLVFTIHQVAFYLLLVQLRIYIKK